MSTRLFPVLVGLVLAGFLAGGALAPTLHRVHHAKEQQEAYEATSKCAHGALTGTPIAESGSAPAMLEACPVLARHVLSVVPAMVWKGASLRHEATRSVVALALHDTPAEGRIVIRGPPGPEA